MFDLVSYDKRARLCDVKENALKNMMHIQNVPRQNVTRQNVPGTKRPKGPYVPRD